MVFIKRIALVLVLAAVPNMVTAEDTAADLVKYRQSLMGGMAAHMRLSSMVLKGRVSAPGELVGHANALHAASTNMGHFWPKGSGPDAIESSSLKNIWEKPEDWNAAITAYKDATKVFAETAQTGDLTTAIDAFKKVGASCGGCHKPFRKDDD